MTRSKAFSIVLLVLLSVVTTKPAPKEPVSSRFYFPHFVSGKGNETTFVISNSSAQDAEVRFTAYGDEGNLLPVRPNRAIVTLNAQSQTQIKAGDLFDIPDGGAVAGWMKAESINPQLSAWMLISVGNLRGDSLDAVGVSDQRTQKMVFSGVFETGDMITAIGLANPDSSAAHVKASLYSEGTLVEVREFQIPGYGHRAWFLNELFQANVPAGHVEMESDVALAGLQTFSQADRWSAVPMQLAEDAAELVVPIPPLQGRFSAKIALANPQDYDLNLSLTAYGNGTDPAAGPVNRLLPAHGELIASVSDLFGGLVPGGNVISIKTDVGLAGIYGVKPAISGLAMLRGEDFAGLASFPLMPARSRESIFSPLSTQSSLSLLNAQDGGAKTRFSMIGNSQKVVGESEITIDARASVSGGLSDLTKATEAGNLVLMSADQPLTSLQIESSGPGFFIIPGQTFKSRALYSSGQLLSRVSGGTVLSKDETVSVSIPLNALKEDTAIQINGLSPAAAPPVDANRRLLAATEFQPAGLEFLFPATIKMSLLRKQTPGSSIPLELANSLTDRYQPSGSTATIGSDGMSASAGISHFSIFALTSEKPAVRVTPAPVTVEVGQTIQFAATVTGNGIQDIDWSVDEVPGGNTTTGRIRPDGFYTAPSTVPPLGWVAVKAVSVDDPTASFQVLVTITRPTETDGPDMPAAPDPVVLSGPVDPSCSGCHAYR
jgi:hypothetical protein